MLFAIKKRIIVCYVIVTPRERDLKFIIASTVVLSLESERKKTSVKLLFFANNGDKSFV